MNVLEESENDVDAEFDADIALQEADEASLDLLDSLADNATNAVNQVTEKFNDLIGGFNFNAHIQGPKISVKTNDEQDEDEKKDKDKENNSYDFNINSDSLKNLFIQKKKKSNLRHN